MRAIAALALCLSAPAFAQSLQQRVEATLANAPTGTRFGLVVADDRGKEIVAVAPDNRFIPASNTKMFPTAATFLSLPSVTGPDVDGGASVRLEDTGRAPPNVVLSGGGDARLSSAADCASDCLTALADAVAARTKRVGDVVGDDSLYPDQRWSQGMSWNNIRTRSGTAISALTIDDNEVALTVTPGAAGAPPAIAGYDYYTIDNRVVTAGSGKTNIDFDRLPNERTIRLFGTIAVGSEPEIVRLGIDDPAHFAAWRLRALLVARGVKVAGQVQARHRPFTAADDPAQRGGAPVARPPRPEPLAKLTPPPLLDDLTLTNKVSQNLHAELFLRRVGLIAGTGSVEDGQVVLRNMLSQAGVPRTGFDFSDGSGMSTYNRLAPRSVVRFLNWIALQPWGAAWRATLPIAGVDGTLSNRFKGTLLEGKLFAKTGSLNATNGLSGYFTARSGRTYTFSAFANDVPSGGSALKAMDAALVQIAEAN